MSTSINTIRENKSGKSYPVTKHANIHLVKADAGDDISVDGTVKNIATIYVTCTVTRHYRDSGIDGMAWTRTLFCQATAGNWSASIGKLAPGIYTFVFAAEGEEIDCVKLEVAEHPKPAFKTVIGIISTGASAMAINIKGSVKYYPQTVSCDLTPITNTGASRGPTSAKAVRSTNGTWIVSYYPTDVDETSFSGLYSFTAYAYEGSASEPISV